MPQWQAVLDQCEELILPIDLDGTAWGDLLVVMNEAFGPVDEAGEKLWKRYDRAFKIDGTMTNGAHLEAEYRDLLGAKKLPEIITWLKANHRLVPGFRAFMDMMKSRGVTVLAISNGAYSFADEMLAHHDIVMPRVCNSLVMEGDAFQRLDFFHNEHDGIRKGDLVTIAAERGHRVIGCAGDSKGDLTLATATAKLGGLVLAVGDHGLAAWCKANESEVGGPEGWLHIHDYADAMAAFDSRLAGF